MDHLIPTLGGPASVRFDRWGGAHVTASNRPDLYRVQGFLHAKARGFQMEVFARSARGRVSELVGQPGTAFDVMARRIGLPQIAVDAARSLEADDLRILEPYAEGVLAGDAATPLSLEYQALGVERTWRPDVESVVLDACALAVLRAFGLSDSWRRRMARAWLSAVEDGAPSEEISLLRATWTMLAAPIAAPDGGGSNAFAVSGGRTASGLPILGADPHLKADAPGAWVEMHLRCPEQHVTGASLPGVPNILAGRNEHVAWALTSSQADVADCVRERIDQETGTYLTPDGWEPLQVRTEVVTVRGGPDVTFEVAETRHGPVLATAIGGSQDAIAFQWVHRHVANRQHVFEAMNEATDCAAFRDALHRYSGVGLGIVYAGADGTIARQQVGPVPRRAKGRPEARLLDGITADGDWLGLLDVTELPIEVNPLSGVLCAANDAPALDATASGEDWDWAGRADRMRELLSRPGALSLEDCSQVPLDLHSPLAALLVPVLVTAAPPTEDSDACGLLDEVRTWDLRLTTDSTAAAVFDRWYLALVRLLLPPDVDPDLVEALESTRVWWSHAGVPRICSRLDSMSDAARVRVSTDAFMAAVHQLRDLWADGPRTYGRLTSTSYEHPLGSALSIGPIEMPGGIDSVWRGDASGRGRGVPVLRQIADLSDIDGGLCALSTGNSGVPGDDHYADQVAGFLRGEYHPWPMGDAETDALTAEEVHLR